MEQTQELAKIHIQEKQWASPRLPLHDSGYKIWQERAPPGWGTYTSAKKDNLIVLFGSLEMGLEEIRGSAPGWKSLESGQC